MSWIDTYLNQTIVYWANAVPDGLGGYTFDTPVEIKGRWDDIQDLKIDHNGQEFVTRALVFVNTGVVLNGYLFLGSLIDIGSVGVDNPTVVDGAFRIRKIDITPSILVDKYVRKAWL